MTNEGTSFAEAYPFSHSVSRPQGRTTLTCYLHEFEDHIREIRHVIESDSQTNEVTIDGTRLIVTFRFPSVAAWVIEGVLTRINDIIDPKDRSYIARSRVRHRRGHGSQHNPARLDASSTAHLR